MGKETGFFEYSRKNVHFDDPGKRTEHFKEFRTELDLKERREQGARCMDCGVPFCQSDYGCPVDNLIPEWNDLIYNNSWKEAAERLLQTNNFPEYTGRVCPAPCEQACVLAINEPAVTIKDNECSIIDWAYDNGYMIPRPPEQRTGKRIAIIGSGPAGLAAADQLNKIGHHVTVFERSDRVGGLLMYGIPNMKLDKELVERRNTIMREEGIEFRLNSCVGKDISTKQLQSEYDAILIATGSTIPRDLPVSGRSLDGVHYAMDFLVPNTKRILNGSADNIPYIDARGKDVIVIGGGDTGNDCLGTSMRHGCKSLRNFELLPKPSIGRDASMPWPSFAKTYKLDYGHAEAQTRFGDDPREYSILTKEFLGNGKLEAIKTIQVAWSKPADGRPEMKEIPGTEREWPADLVFISLGFLGPERGILEDFGLESSKQGTILAEYGRFETSVPGIYAAGDARRGQSLVVWAIKEGREAAVAVDHYVSQK